MSSEVLDTTLGTPTRLADGFGHPSSLPFTQDSPQNWFPAPYFEFGDRFYKAILPPFNNIITPLKVNGEQHQKTLMKYAPFRPNRTFLLV